MRWQRSLAGIWSDVWLWNNQKTQIVRESPYGQQGIKKKKRKDFNSHLQPQAQRHLLWIQSLPLDILSTGQQTSLESTDSKCSGMDLKYLWCEKDRFSGQQMAWWEKGRVLGVLHKSRSNLLFLVLDIFVESHRSNVDSFSKWTNSRWLDFG